jgi:hypothetical protein
MVLKISYPGITQTLNYLIIQIKESLPYARKFIAMHNICNARQLFDALKKRVNYTKDPAGIEYIQTWPTLARNGYCGDCDCFTVAVCAGLHALGYPTAIVIQARKIGNPRHILSAYNERGRWVPFDLTNAYLGKIRTYPFTQIITVSKNAVLAVS